MRHYIEGFIVGVCVIITIAVVCCFVELNKTVTTDHANLTQVVNFLNQQISANQKSSSAPITK